MAEAGDLASAIRKRTTIKSSLTRFATYVNKFTENDNVLNLKSRLDDARGILGKYDSVQCEIEDLDPDTNYEDERLRFENQFYDLMAIAEQTLSARTGGSSVAIAESINSSSDKRVKLPTITIMKYDGTYQGWSRFRDSFKTLIHDNADLNNVQKYLYLQSSLTDRAAETINELEINAENYDVAWKLLCDRFENKRLIVFEHVKAIVDFPSLQRENAKGLRHLLDEYFKHTRALKALQVDTSEWGILLLHIVTSKFDINTRKLWEIETNKSQELPNLQKLEEFLKGRCTLLESISINCGDKNKTTYQARAVANHSIAKCVSCKGSHAIFNCKSFLALNTDERRTEVRKLRLCYNCLGEGHSVKNCKSRPCKTCKHKHNDLLHQELQTEGCSKGNNRETELVNTALVQDSADATIDKECLVDNGDTIQISGCATDKINENKHNKKLVLLGTVKIWVLGNAGKTVIARALLDTGSSANYVSKRFANELGIAPRHISSMRIAGVNNSSSIVNKEILATIKSRQSGFKVQGTFLIVDKVTEDLPLCSFEGIRVPSGICLADEEFNSSSEIEILLGSQVTYNAFLSGVIRDNDLIYRETVFGWIVVGAVNLCVGANGTEVCCLSRVREGCLEQEECEAYFASTTLRGPDGRFVVKYPVNENVGRLESNFETALVQFLKLEAKLKRNGDLYDRYKSFMNEYLMLGHMEKIRELSCKKEIDNFIREERQTGDGRRSYIPHHPVFKIDSSTTKLRVVYNGSSIPHKNAFSLNDCLKNGPVQQSQLFKILLSFRKHNTVFTADMEKMYRQVWVNAEDCDLQRIVWRNDSEEALGIYRLKTVTYGLKPSGYLATRCIKQLAMDFEEEFPDAAKILFQDTYVDDLISGADTARDAITLKGDLDSILASAGFRLRKWRSNSVEFLDHCELESSDTKHFIKDNDEQKTLGIYWEATDDSFRFLINVSLTKWEGTTKREALSIVSRLFDPLGLVGPVVIVAKLFVQHLWTRGLGWDEQLPSDLQADWERAISHLLTVNTLRIPRRIVCLNPVDVRLVGFSDASMKAYGCAIYLRSKDNLGNVTVRLVWAKSRLAPLQKRGAKITLPRLELNGALLLAQNMKLVSDELKLNCNAIYCWTDSMIVLYWLRKPPGAWKPYVATRVASVQALTLEYHWRHVSSKDNPADLVSRGVDSRELATSIWFEGPNWLKEDVDTWPSFNIAVNESEVPERRIQEISNVTLSESTFFTRFSTLRKLVRTVAWCLRFAHNLRSGNSKILSCTLLPDEVNTAMNRLLRIAQAECLGNEFNDLSKSKAVHKTSRILSLDPFLDDSGLIRVGGRIARGEFDFNKCHPIILPKDHKLTNLIIKHAHWKNLHAGPHFLLAEIRERYWPISGLTAVKRVIRECVVCIRFGARTLFQKMGNLPKTRLVPSFPFQVVNIDYCGPFLIKERRVRNRGSIKTYVCIFICQSTKAIHLEVANDLSSSAFLNCFKRFISRRGMCTEVVSDNATNFVAADKYLRGIAGSLKDNENSEVFRGYLTDNKISWKFLPKRSPHFGGLHENAVKLFKSHFRKVLFQHKMLTFDDLITVTCHIESILNSRPLVPLSADPQDTTALTPGHFMIGRRLDGIIESPTCEVASNRLTQYQMIRKIIESFWKAWSKQYLSTLQPRAKWRHLQSNSLKVGDLIIIRDIGLPPQQWRLGRVATLHPGRDGLTRVVELHTSTGTTTRAITEIIPLVNDANSPEVGTSAGEDVGENAGVRPASTRDSLALRV